VGLYGGASAKFALAGAQQIPLVLRGKAPVGSWAAFLIGGAVNGGRVLANWPGLSPERLYQNRDLAPTMDLRSIAKAVLKDHMGLPEPDLDRFVFPRSERIEPYPEIVLT